MKRWDTQVVALEPDEAFARQVLAYKERVGESVGEQLYLEDPPHLTLYVGVFGAGVELSGPIQDVCGRLAAPTAAIRGWHVFEGDQLTGNHTLVCDVAPEARGVLQQMQKETVAAVAGLRNPQAARACYDESWHRLSEAERANVKRYGFPFVGAVWHPHVTVASVRPEDWETVWPRLAGMPPDAVVRFPHLCVYGLDGTRPVRLGRFSLEERA